MPLDAIRCVRLGLCAAIASAALAGCERPQDDPSAVWRVEYQTTDGAFLSVWGPESDDVFVVGGQRATPGDPGTGLMVHYDGEEWEGVDLPDGTPNLNWVYGIEGEFWVAGHRGVVLRGSLDGFELMETGVPDVPLWGVWGTASDDVWAVGGEVLDSEAVPHLLHYDGSDWEDVALPALDRPSTGLLKVWGTAADNIYAVGMGGVILHYDGTSWEQQPSGTVSDLVSLWGTGPEEIVAIGGRSNGTMVRYGESGWEAQNLTGLPGQNGVWMDSMGSCLIVGTQGSASVLDPGSLGEFEQEDPAVGFNVLHAVYGFDDGVFFSVGGNLDQSPPYVGLVSVRRFED